jgi:hypothetical protein
MGICGRAGTLGILLAVTRSVGLARRIDETDLQVAPWKLSGAWWKCFCPHVKRAAGFVGR